MRRVVLRERRAVRVDMTVLAAQLQIAELVAAAVDDRNSVMYL